MGMPYASAADTTISQPAVSSWAQDEVSQAKQLGLIPNSLISSNYQEPITRQQYIEIAMEYVSLQQNCDSYSLKGLASFYLAKKLTMDIL
jgi:hypothetical protein